MVDTAEVGVTIGIGSSEFSRSTTTVASNLGLPPVDENCLVRVQTAGDQVSSSNSNSTISATATGGGVRVRVQFEEE